MLLCSVVVAVTLPSSVAQEGRRRRGDPFPTGDTALLHVSPAPGQIPHSLKELCNASSLIVECTVRTTLSPREPSARSLETDAVISVNRTLKGSVTVKEIIIAQRGGFRGDLNIRPAQYSLVQPGEECILFLTEDSRPKIPPAAGGLKRYLVTGIWSGLFTFEGGRMRVKADEPDPLRTKYQGLTLDQVIAEVTAALTP